MQADFAPGGNWQADSARLLGGFFGSPPFKTYRGLFNVHLVEVVSLDRGADDGPEIYNKRTAFDACYGYEGIERLLVCRDEGAVLRAARNAPAADILLVLVNDSRPGGSAEFLGQIPAACCSNEPTSFLTALHELGHSFAGLGDEYVDEAIREYYPLPDLGDLPAPNLTLARFVDTRSRERLIGTLKWGHFLQEPGAIQRYGTGYHEGGYYRARDVYRPAASCLMANEGGTFCLVCHAEITKAIYRASGQGSLLDMNADGKVDIYDLRVLFEESPGGSASDCEPIVDVDSRPPREITPAPRLWSRASFLARRRSQSECTRRCSTSGEEAML